MIVSHRCSLNVDDAAEFLDAIEKQISLLDGILILLVLAVGAIGLHDAVDFVDLRVESAGGDESVKTGSKIKGNYYNFL